MTMKIIRFASLSLCLLIVSEVPEALGQGQRITFDNAVSIALDRNVELRKAENDVGLARREVSREKADFFPDLNLSSSLSRNWGLGFSPDFTRVTETTDFLSLRASGSVVLFNGFENTASYKRSKLELESSGLAFDRARQTVVFNVIQSYLQVLLDKERVRIRTEDIESQSQQLARIEEFVRVGSRPVSDLYQQQATLANSELLLLESERSVQLSEVRLIQVLELDPLSEYSFDSPSAEELLPDVRTYDLDALMAEAFDRRLDLQAMDARIDAAHAGVRIAKSTWYPRVSLSGGGDSRAIWSNARDNLPFGDQFDDNKSADVGLNLTIPIFDRLQTKTNLQRARIMQSNLELDRQNLEQTIALEVRQAHLDYLTAVKRLDVTEKQLRAARQSEAVERERYDIGASTLVELTQARAALVDAESQRAQAVYQFIFQEQVIEYHLGSLNPVQRLFEQD
jgi:outer membrane protein